MSFKTLAKYSLIERRAEVYFFHLQCRVGLNHLNLVMQLYNALLYTTRRRAVFAKFGHDISHDRVPEVIDCASVSRRLTSSLCMSSTFASQLFRFLTAQNAANYKHWPKDTLSVYPKTFTCERDIIIFMYPGFLGFNAQVSANLAPLSNGEICPKACYCRTSIAPFY